MIRIALATFAVALTGIGASTPGTCVIGHCQPKPCPVANPKYCPPNPAL